MEAQLFAHDVARVELVSPEEEAVMHLDEEEAVMHLDKDTEAERSNFHQFRNTKRRLRPVEASRPR